MAYEALDFYDVNDLLTEEEQMVRDSVRGWVEERVMPVIAGHFRDGTFPRQMAREMGELGLLGAHLDGYGCAGMGQVAYGLICQELERGDSGDPLVRSVQGSLVMYPIHAMGSEEQKQKWLLRAGRGNEVDRLLRPDRARLRLRPGRHDRRRARRRRRQLGAERRQDVDHERRPARDMAIVWAKTSEDGIRGFIVPSRILPASAAPEHRSTSGACAPSITSELVLEDVRVSSEDALLPGSEGT